MAGKQREHYLALIVLLCVGAFGADRLVLGPMTRLWDARAKRIAELDRLIAQGSVLAGREAALAERWSAMREQSRSRETSATENEVLNAVSRWAAQSKLTVTSLKPRWILDEDECRKLEIQVSTSGELGAVARFLYELETDPQALKVEDIDLTARDNTGRTIAGGVRFTRLVLDKEKRKP